MYARCGVGRIDCRVSSLLPLAGEKVGEARMRGRTSGNGANIKAAMPDEQTIKRARKNRKAPTSAGDRLWSILRGGRYRGIKFRRQHPIGPYVVDFACVGRMLVIEVDGPSHDEQEQRAFDAERTALLERSGWRVVRIANADVFNDEGIYLILDEVVGA